MPRLHSFPGGLEPCRVLGRACAGMAVVEPPLRCRTLLFPCLPLLQVVAVDRSAHPLWTLRTPEEAAAAWQAEFGGPRDESHPHDPLVT